MFNREVAIAILNTVSCQESELLLGEQAEMQEPDLGEATFELLAQAKVKDMAEILGLLDYNQLRAVWKQENDNKARKTLLASIKKLGKSLAPEPKKETRKESSDRFKAWLGLPEGGPVLTVHRTGKQNGNRHEFFISFASGTWEEYRADCQDIYTELKKIVGDSRNEWERKNNVHVYKHANQGLFLML